jgi:hypothetical protein
MGWQDISKLYLSLPLGIISANPVGQLVLKTGIGGASVTIILCLHVLIAHRIFINLGFADKYVIMRFCHLINIISANPVGQLVLKTGRNLGKVQSELAP